MLHATNEQNSFCESYQHDLCNAHIERGTFWSHGAAELTVPDRGMRIHATV